MNTSATIARTAALNALGNGRYTVTVVHPTPSARKVLYVLGFIPLTGDTWEWTDKQPRNRPHPLEGRFVKGRYIPDNAGMPA